MAIILNDEIILGSGSETRLELLKRHGLNINNFAPTVDEEQLKNEHCQDMGPNEMALFLAKAKAKDVSAKFPDAYVIAADQVCELKGRVFDKPGNRENAIKHLKLLRNQTHNQNCAMVIARNCEIIYVSITKAYISLRDLSDSEIEAYIDLEQPFQSCGAYMLEKHGKHIFKSIEGDHDVILGLDVVELFNKLYELKAIELKP